MSKQRPVKEQTMTIEQSQQQEYVTTGNWFDEFVGVPLGEWKKPEPLVKRKGTPVWILVRYINNSGMTPKQVAALYGLTEREVNAACAYWQTFPWRVDDKLAEEA
jgi:uncharacterized protein (DUF433 family)